MDWPLFGVIFLSSVRKAGCDTFYNFQGIFIIIHFLTDAD